mmetsp:Transcript_34247/g.50343  ORF Transcript_34247/g.50343 Transcript_34247/m.50343 type:complete len:133 (+) Transcript_34247:52-450(+)|eukprot:CAMPEP_0195522756 /NCGR_PEP_ID=MMETSP0794_2-20130614/21250_1 /TAXON_ID=515487 /ORGANISM="Stephanopyxis turris, Strain CCMP 815" /LENGTH=132 /DNA_ID=CAMNT_0040652595 /DNA_START=51 /DNA_END=449 /DNA_ORIENTATION=+
MATRGVKQLLKLRLCYCEVGGSSRNVREYISSGKVVEFAKENPTVSVIVQTRNGKHPMVKGHYITGYDKQICVKNEPIKRIDTVVNMLNNSSGRKMKKFGSPVKTVKPSVQGVWTPYLDIAERKFPIEIVEG